ncbi:YopX family protein [Helicobacter sp.]|uniref:YopX family protein n=1 Tax=Helicobacter sp. TaxID=218 RepID=UPI0025C3C3EC|nr:YopX family protein [Helicobacter sp.]MCI5632409.1 YopX family protein [Helicobacter sp.]
MKLQDIDFRVWSKLENGYIEYPALAKLCSVLPAKVHRADRAIPFIEFDERDDKKEVEFWSGLIDLNNAKIYEGDIVAHYAEGGGIEYYSKVVFNQEKGAFEFVCIEHPITPTLDELESVDIRQIGNIHENPELLGGEK